jgi:hypothetical protein
MLTVYTPALEQAEEEVTLVVVVVVAAAERSNQWTSDHPVFVVLSLLEPLSNPYH